MFNTINRSKILIFLLFTALVGCGGGGGDSAPPPPPTVTTISGVVSAPATTVAQYEKQNVMRMLASLLISDLHAAITGLTPVTSATVELIRINASGVQVGAVLETTTTNAVTGEYSLDYDGTLSSDLVVQVTGSSGVPMRALAVSETTDINPVTEYVMQQILDSINSSSGAITLSSVTETSVDDLISFVESLDITFTGTETVEETKTAIDSVAASEMDDKVAEGLYTIDLNGKTASSVISTNFCTDGTTGGWDYTFTNTGMTMFGSDSFNSDGAGNCAIGADETMTLTHADVIATDDIPFNCGNDHVCNFSDLNKVITGVDGDSRNFTSTYSHIPGTNTILYVKSASDGTSYTEIITLIGGASGGGSGPVVDTSIVGAWDFGHNTINMPGMVVFYENGFYIHYEADNTGGCSVGVEYGTYTYDGTTLNATQTVDNNGLCGLTETPFNVTITGDQFAVAGDQTLTRVDGGAGSLVGAWDVGGSTATPIGIVFYSNGFYIHWQDNSTDPNCSPDGGTTPGGVEYGTYTYNSANTVGIMTTSMPVDENFECGLSDMVGVTEFSVTGDVLTVTDSQGTDTINRLKAGSTPVSSLACGTVGGPYSYTDFMSVVSSCGSFPITDADLIGKSFNFATAPDEQYTFNADNTGVFTNDGGTTNFNITWLITQEGYLNIEYDIAGVGTTDLIDQFVAYAGDATTTGLFVKAYTEGEDPYFGDMVFDNTADGEIFQETVLEVSNGGTS